MVNVRPAKSCEPSTTGMVPFFTDNVNVDDNVAGEFP